MLIEQINSQVVNRFAKRNYADTIIFGRLDRIGRDNSRRLCLPEHVEELCLLVKFKSPCPGNIGQQGFARGENQAQVVREQFGANFR